MKEEKADRGAREKWKLEWVRVIVVERDVFQDQNEENCLSAF